ncbi:MAG: hypothetical protein ABW094_11835 [Candidatus Thiodiazotropha sp.]
MKISTISRQVTLNSIPAPLFIAFVFPQSGRLCSLGFVFICFGTSARVVPGYYLFENVEKYKVEKI